MHPYDIMVIISIACCVGYSLAIYEERDPILVLGYFVASTAGAFAGSYFVVWAFPEFHKFGMIGGGLAGAALLAVSWKYVWRLKGSGHA